MTDDTIHTCSYECERPGCIRAQRDELAARLTAAMSQPAGDAEAKTVPVPTRVHLIGETAVIVGTPGRGWDEDAQDAHNCDAMGCATIGPHVLARVPFTDERALPQPAEAQAQGGGEVVQRLRGVLEHGKMGDKCLIAPDLVTAAIAALSAQQSPAEAQPVAKLVNRKDADGGKTTTFIRPTGFGMDLPLGEYPLHLHPSAPTGDDRWKALIGQWQRRVEAAGYDGVEDALDAAIVARDAGLAPTETQAQGGGEVAGWVLEDTFVNAKFWTADTPPQGWTPVYYTAPPSAPVGVEDVEVLKRLRAALPDVGLNGWWLGVEVLDRVIDALTQQPAAVDVAVDKARFKRAPCYLCGYNGPGYYQPDTHPCAAKYHATQHQEPTT